MGTQGGQTVGFQHFAALTTREKEPPLHHQGDGGASHVPFLSLLEGTQRVYGLGLFFVSARTNKGHHHQGASTRLPRGGMQERKTEALGPAAPEGVFQELKNKAAGMESADAVKPFESWCARDVAELV